MHGSLVSSNKISPLVPNNPVDRMQLYGRLRQPDGKSAFWVSGPGGVGKSTLVASYLAKEGIPSLWYKVDGLDADPSASVFYLREAVTAFTGQKENTIPLLTSEYLPNMDVFFLRFFELLYQRLLPGGWLVFDNVQDAPPDSPFSAIVSTAVKLLPASCGLVVISREEPSDRLMRFVANRQLQAIGGEELLFSVDEVRLLLHQENHSPAQTTAEMLHAVTGGWVAGIILLLRRIGVAEDMEMAVFDAPHQDIFSYFAGEVFARADEALQQCLLLTSQLPVMTASMVTALLGEEHATMLERLWQGNHFVERRKGLQTMCQYHPLFHAFLKEKAAKTLSRRMLSEIRQRAAAVLENHGFFSEAIALYGEVAEYASVARIIIAEARQMVAKGRYRTLAGWICQLPREVVHRHPVIMYWKGISLMTEDPRQGIVACTSAFSLSGTVGDLSGQIASWSAIIEGYLVLRDSFTDLDVWITEGERLEREYARLRAEDAAHLAAGMVIALLLRDHGHPRLPIWQGRCEVLLGSELSPEILPILVSALTWSYLWLGEVDKTIVLDRRVQGMLALAEIPAMGRLWGLSVRGMTAVAIGDHELALNTVAKFNELSMASGINANAFLVNAFAVYTGLCTGDLPLVKVHLKRLKTLLAPHAAWDYAQYYFLQAWYQTENGDDLQAQEKLKKAMKFLAECDNPYTTACGHILAAQLCLDRQEYQRAREIIATVQDNPRLRLNHYLRYVMLLVLADCAFCEKQPVLAAQQIWDALAIIREKGVGMLFPLVHRRMGNLFAEAVSVGVCDNILLEIARRWRFRPQTSERVSGSWPWPLKVRTFGGLELYRETSLLSLTGKSPRKNLELLLLLIVAGPAGLPKTSVAYRLWPESDGDRAIQNLHTALHRLRRFLDDEEAVVLKGGFLALNPAICWVDCWYFSWMVRQMQQVARPDPARLLELMAIYAGSFVPEFADVPFISYHAAVLTEQMTRLRQQVHTLVAEGVIGAEYSIRLQEEMRRIDALADGADDPKGG